MHGVQGPPGFPPPPGVKEGRGEEGLGLLLSLEVRPQNKGEASGSLPSTSLRFVVGYFFLVSLGLASLGGALTSTSVASIRY